MQNKLHWAIHGHTASELVSLRADSTKPHTGLTSWKHAPRGKVQKSDVHVAKNYLNEEEIRGLNQVVTMYLDFAELQAQRKNRMSMTDWVQKLDSFLAFNDFKVLDHLGKVSAEVAKQFAQAEYEKFRPVQDRAFVSDFDKSVK